MRIVIGLILGAFLVFLGVQSHLFYARVNFAKSELEQVEADLERVRRDSETIRSDRSYYENPVNLEKELRARFNYRDQNEELMILVPSTSTGP